jgi:hypothetical protein
MNVNPYASINLNQIQLRQLYYELHVTLAENYPRTLILWKKIL